MAKNNWTITYHKIETGTRSYGQESLLTLGNGYLGWRGAPVLAKNTADHYPGLYVAGVYNQTKTPVDKREVVNEDLVNLPNPQLVELDLDGENLVYKPTKRQTTLDLQTGVLKEHAEFVVSKGRLQVDTVKVVDPLNFHVFAENINIKSDFSAALTLRGIIDGTVINNNVARYRAFHAKEFTVKDVDGECLVGQTLTTGITFALAAKTWLQHKVLPGSAAGQTSAQVGKIDLQPGQVVSAERVMAVATSREERDPQKLASQAITSTSFTEVLDHSETYWRALWEKADIELMTPNESFQRLLRLNIFQLNQAAQLPANQHLDASVGSRGLTGEGYRGHIFWDEIFVLPYYSTMNPKVTYALSHYRIKRLKAAMANAQKENEAGAMYPWQSALYGDEQAQIIHLNPVDHQWIPDNSRLERHVSLAILYNIWHYTKVTGCQDLLLDGGLDVLCEVLKFWINKADFDGSRYHIAGVMGPDEFHEAYPHQLSGGLTDNAYTNLMVVWALNWFFALRHEAQDKFADLIKAHGLTEAFLQKAEDMRHKLALEINQDGIIAQYQGFFALKELDFAAYRQKYGDIHRIDRLLKAEGKDSNDYQAIKQADLLMLLYNFDTQTIFQLVQQLGYTLPTDWLIRNRDYYLARTTHGSTTSRPVFAGVDAELHQLTEAEDFLTTAIRSDFDDIQGGTTAEGIHIGVMGETVKVLENNLAGVHFNGQIVSVWPAIPKDWSYLKFHQQFHGIWYTFEFLSGDSVRVTVDQATVINIEGKDYELTVHRPLTVSLGGAKK